MELTNPKPEPTGNPAALAKHEAYYALRLLKRKPEEKYILEWTKQFEEEKKIREQKAEISMIVFRLGDQRIGLSTKVFAEIINRRKILRIPHRTKGILLGVVNFRGRLTPCINLEKLLEIEPETGMVVRHEDVEHQHMLAIQDRLEVWVFPVVEVFGIYHWDVEQLEINPEAPIKLKNKYVRGIFKCDGEDVGYLNEELLFSRLKRGV